MSMPTHDHRDQNLHHAPPPWEVQTLLSNTLDAKTLATAACVSKSWRDATSSDHIWQKLASSHFPSLTSTLKAFVQPPLPYRRIYALAHSAAAKRSRLMMIKPEYSLPKPSLSLHHIIFAFDIQTGFHRVSFSGPAEEVAVFDSNDVFRFDVDLDLVAGEEVRMTWHAVVRDDDKRNAAAPSVLTLMDGSVVKVRKEAGGEAVGWLSEELPQPPGCCCCNSNEGAWSRMVADLKMGFCGGEEATRVEKVSLGLLSTEKWRYVSVDDGLRYLQHFLLDK